MHKYQELKDETIVGFFFLKSKLSQYCNKEQLDIIINEALRIRSRFTKNAEELVPSFKFILLSDNSVRLVLLKTLGPDHYETMGAIDLCERIISNAVTLALHMLTWASVPKYHLKNIGPHQLKFRLDDFSKIIPPKHYARIEAIRVILVEQNPDALVFDLFIEEKGIKLTAKNGHRDIFSVFFAVYDEEADTSYLGEDIPENMFVCA